MFLPPPSPELQPAERLGPLIDELVANRTFATLDELEAVLGERCRTLRADPAPVQALDLLRLVAAGTPPTTTRVMTRIRYQT